jgi:putative tricarboxylic transport membrane protein
MPGYDLFTVHGSTTYAIMLGFLAANILMGVFGFILAKYAVRLASMPAGILLPLIIVLSVVGSFAINGNMFDVRVMLFFGLLGYFMQKFDFPAAPVVLALILGPMAERDLVNSMQMAKVPLLEYYATRPLCWLFFVFIILSIAGPVMAAVKKSKKRKLEASKQGTDPALPVK